MLSEHTVITHVRNILKKRTSVPGPSSNSWSPNSNRAHPGHSTRSSADLTATNKQKIPTPGIP